MCGRGVRPDGAKVAEAIKAELVDDELRDLPMRYNLAPTDPVGVIWSDSSRRRLSVARWGVPRRRGGIAINARDDRLRSGIWVRLLRSSRAVIPLCGFYEWEGPQRQPWYFRRSDDGLMLMAGLILDDPTGRHVAIVTTTPSGDIGGIHDRMPAILEPNMVDPWLRSEELAMVLDFVRPTPEGTLRRHAVSRAVGNVRNDGPELIEPLAESPTQRELF